MKEGEETEMLTEPIELTVSLAVDLPVKLHITTQLGQTDINSILLWQS